MRRGRGRGRVLQVCLAVLQIFVPLLQVLLGRRRLDVDRCPHGLPSLHIVLDPRPKRLGPRQGLVGRLEAKVEARKSTLDGRRYYVARRSE